MEEKEKKEVEEEKTTEEPTPIPEKKTDEIDYAAELGKVQAELQKKEDQLKKAEYKLYQKSKAERQEDDVGEIDDDPKVIVEEGLKKFEQSFLGDKVDEEIARLSDDPNEQKLIKHFYENKIVKSGVSRAEIADDIIQARLLANRKKIEKQNSELFSALKSEKNKNSSGSATGQKVDETELPKLSPLEEKILARQGLTAKDIKS